jgi:alpha-tubulin suppressor-like RCC1 family protein
LQDGQLGIGGKDSYLNVFPPRYLTSMRNKQPAKVAAGARHSMILTKSGNVFVFGSNARGQLGLYDETHRLPETAWPLVVPKLVDVYCVDIYAFGYSSIAVEMVGVPLVWGANNVGQLTRDTSTIYFPKPVIGTESKRIVRAAAGGSHSLFLDSYGQVYSQGSNLFGQLGYETSDAVTGQRMHPVEGLGVVLVIAAGYSHSAAVNKHQQLFMWGRNMEGQLGVGTVQSQTIPRLVPLQRVVRVACGYYHTLAVTADGKIYSWGQNKAGQLGLKDFKTRISPVEIRLSSAAVWCDSYDSTTISESFQNQVCVNSKLTVGSVVVNEAPLPLNVTVVDVYAGDVHSAAVTIDQNVFLWGSNEQNQLAMGAPSIVGRFFYEPFLAVSLYGKNLTSVALGERHTLMRVDREKFYIDKMLPLSGPVDGGTPAYFIGKGYTTFNGQMLAIFSRSCEPAVIQGVAVCSSRTLSFQVPVLKVSNLRLLLRSPSILINGSDMFIGVYNVSLFLKGEPVPTRQPITFQYFGLPTVARAQPSRGPKEGKSLTRIFGSGFDTRVATDVRCRWELLEVVGVKYDKFDINPYTGDLMWVRADIIDNSTIQCEGSPAQATNSKAIIRVTINGADYSSTFAPYVFYNEPKLSSVSVPQPFLPVNPATKVQYVIGGTGATAGLYSIPYDRDSLVDVNGVGLGDAVVGESKLLIAGAPAIVVQFTPLFMRCFVKARPELAANFSANSTILLVNVSVSLNGQDFSKSQLSLAYVTMPSLATMKPSGGPSLVPTMIQVTGSGFLQIPNFYPLCLFTPRNSTALIAQAINQSVLVPVNSSIYIQDDKSLYCQVPNLAIVPGTESVLWDVTVTMNCQHYFSGGLVYNLFRQPYIAAVVPSGSPIGINSTVLMHGRGFSVHVESLKMRFGSVLKGQYEISLNSFFYSSLKVKKFDYAITSVCILLSDVLMRCPLPRNVSSAIFALQITLNDVDYNPETDIQFQFYEQAKVFSFVPGGGPKQGGTMISIRGTGLSNFGEKSLCRFGSEQIFDSQRNQFISAPEIITPLMINDDTSALCVSPARPGVDGIAVVKFSLTLNNLDYEGSSSLDFSYYEHPKIVSMTPGGGHTLGNNSIVILGSGFLRYKEKVRCRFGTVEVVGVSQRDDIMNCVTPPHEVATVSIEVTLNGIDYSVGSKTFFSFYTRPVLTSIFPRGGRFMHTVSDQSTSVVVSGKYLDGYSENVRMRWSWDGGRKFIMSSVQVLSSTEALVIAPPSMRYQTVLDTFDVDLEITLNGFEFSFNSKISFRFFSEPNFNDFYPRGGPRQGGTIVTYIGKGFERFNDGSVLAKFGTKVVKCEEKRGTILIEETFDADADINAVPLEFYGSGWRAANPNSTAAPPTIIDGQAEYIKTYVASKSSWPFQDIGLKATKDKCGSVERKALVFDGPSMRPIEGRWIISKPIDLSRGGVLRFFMRAGTNDPSDACHPPRPPENALALYTIAEDEKNPLMRPPSYFELPSWKVIEVYNITKYSSKTFQSTSSSFDRDDALIVCPKNTICVNLRARLMFKQKVHAQGPFNNWALDNLEVSSRGGISDEETMFCETPVVAELGPLPLAVSVNGQQYSPVKSVGPPSEFQYYDHPILRRLEPGGGPTAGRTTITISGSGFKTFANPVVFDEKGIRKYGPLCKFGPSRVPAEIRDDSTVICYSTASLFEEIVNVEVSLNGIDFTTSDPPVKFSYFKHPTVLSITPTSGPFEGGSSVIISGSGFRKVDMIPIAWFLSIDDPAVRYETDCRVFNDTSIICSKMPKMSAMESDEFLSVFEFYVELSLNRIDVSFSNFLNRKSLTNVDTLSLPVIYRAFRESKITSILSIVPDDVKVNAWFENGFPMPVTVLGTGFQGHQSVSCAFLSEKLQKYGPVFTPFLFRSSKEVLCQPLPLPMQEYLGLTKAKLFLSFNSVDVYVNSGGEQNTLYYQTPETETSKTIKGTIIGGALSFVLFVLFVVYRRYVKSHAKFVLDVGGEWQKPVLKKALQKQRESCPRRAGNLYPIYATNAEELGHFGVGIGLYYLFLRFMIFVFLIIAVVHSISMIINVSGNGFGEQRTDVDRFGRASIGNHKEVPSVSLFGRTLEGQNVPLVLSVVDVTAMLVFIVSWVRLRSQQLQTVEDIDAGVMTIADYTVYVEDLPPDCFNPEEFKQFFSQFGQVADVQVGLNNGNLITLINKRSVFNIELELAQAELKQTKLSTQESVVKKIAAKMRVVDKNISQIRNAAIFKSIVAYVTFNEQSAQDKCIKKFQTGFFGRLLADSKMKFRSKHNLTVSQAVEPSNIKWENLEVRGHAARARVVLTSILTVTMLLVSLAILIVLKGLNESLKQSGGAAVCLEAPDVESPDAQQITRWYKYTSSNAKYQMILACYCSKRRSTAGAFCNDYDINQRNLLILNLVSILGVIVINAVLSKALVAFALFERHHSVTGEEKAIAQKVFLSQFMNTAIINTLLNTDLVYFFPSLQPGKDANLLTGIHKDFTPEWYVSVGQALAGVVLPACITPNIMLMMQYPIAVVKRYFLAGCVLFLLQRRGSCCEPLYRQQKTQRQLDELFMGPK